MDRPVGLPRRSFAPDRETRILRHRLGELEARVDLASSALPPIGAARRLVQVYNAGSMPSAPDHFCAANPVEVDGTETEGGTASFNIDTSTTLYVDVLWHAPNAGDILTAYAVGGRWVAEKTAASGQGLPCGADCMIPEQDLTVSWTNPLLGNGSTTLTYNAGPKTWTSSCSNGLLCTLKCNLTENTPEFIITYFISGVCPTGQNGNCSTLGTNPNKLTRTGLTCGAEFLLTAECDDTGCPVVFSNGFTGFTVSL
jgi:hypothetical protein